MTISNALPTSEAVTNLRTKKPLLFVAKQQRPNSTAGCSAVFVKIRLSDQVRRITTGSRKAIQQGYRSFHKPTGLSLQGRFRHHIRNQHHC